MNLRHTSTEYCNHVDIILVFDVQVTVHREQFL